jgi:hypothetical protein
VHHVDAMGVIERAIAAAVVPGGLVRIRTLPLTDEQLALGILDALEAEGLRIVGATEGESGQLPNG